MVAIINKKYILRQPNGKTGTVSVFDYNLKFCAGDPIIQLDDNSWNYIKNLEIIGVE